MKQAQRGDYVKWKDGVWELTSIERDPWGDPDEREKLFKLTHRFGPNQDNIPVIYVKNTRNPFKRLTEMEVVALAAQDSVGRE
jgi:hypothetical protein